MPAHYAITDQQVTDLLPQGDAAFDALLTDLHSRGMEVLDLTPDQVAALAAADFTVDAGTDITVTGTGFLSAPNTNIGQLGAFLGAADVAVRLSDSDLGNIISAGDPAFDKLIHDLQQAGMDSMELDSNQVDALANEGFSFNLGTDVTVTGTGFLHANGVTALGVGTLLNGADVTVRLTNQDLGHVLSGGDAVLDALVKELQHAGMDNLELDAGQVASLANGTFSFDAGTAVTVAGTGFLHANGVTTAGLGALLGAADVTVRLSQQDLGHVLHDGDAAMDSLIHQLQSAGMDHLELDAGQVAQLARADFSFDAGTAITVTGTGFLNANGLNATNLGALLHAADTTVRLSEQDLGKVLHAGDSAMDSLVQQLHSVGMDHLELDAGQVAALAAAHFSFDAGTAITVVGTGFLHANGVTTQNLDTLLGAANVTVRMSDQDLGKILASSHADTAMNGLTTELHDLGVDSLALNAGQALELAQALSGVALTSALPVEIDSAMTLAHGTDADLAALHTLLGSADTTAELTMADLRGAQLDSVSDLQEAMDGMQHALTEAGIDHIDLSDELAHALSQANVEFLPSAADMVGGTGQDIVVTAQADTDSTAYLESSLAELQKLGVDEIKVADGVDKVEVAMGSTANGGFTLDDLPHFQVASGTEVDLIVTEDDLANLLSDSTAFDKLADLGFSDLVYTGDTSSASYAALAGNTGSLHVEAAALTPVEVQLLGLGDEPTDPMDPFHKQA